MRPNTTASHAVGAARHDASAGLDQLYYAYRFSIGCTYRGASKCQPVLTSRGQSGVYSATPRENVDDGISPDDAFRACVLRVKYRGRPSNPRNAK